MSIRNVTAAALCTAVAASSMISPANAMILIKDTNANKEPVCSFVLEDKSDVAYYLGLMADIIKSDFIYETALKDSLNNAQLIPESQLQNENIRTAYSSFLDALNSSFQQRGQKLYSDEEIKNKAYLNDAWSAAADQLETVILDEAKKDPDRIFITLNKDRFAQQLLAEKPVAGESGLVTNILTPTGFIDNEPIKVADIDQGIQMYESPEAVPDFITACKEAADKPAGYSRKLSHTGSVESSLTNLYQSGAVTYSKLLDSALFAPVGKKFVGVTIQDNVPAAAMSRALSITDQDLLASQAYYAALKTKYPQLAASMNTDALKSNPFAATNISVTKDGKEATTTGVKDGDKVILTNTANLDDSYQLQWYKGDEKIEGATGKTLEVTVSSEAQSYRCVATSNSGSMVISGAVIAPVAAVEPPKEEKPTPKPIEDNKPTNPANEQEGEKKSGSSATSVWLIAGLLAILGIASAAAMAVMPK